MLAKRPHGGASWFLPLKIPNDTCVHTHGWGKTICAETCVPFRTFDRMHFSQLASPELHCHGNWTQAGTLKGACQAARTSSSLAYSFATTKPHHRITFRVEHLRDAAVVPKSICPQVNAFTELRSVSKQGEACPPGQPCNCNCPLSHLDTCLLLPKFQFE